MYVYIYIIYIYIHNYIKTGDHEQIQELGTDMDDGTAGIGSSQPRVTQK